MTVITLLPAEESLLSLQTTSIDLSIFLGYIIDRWYGLHLLILHHLITWPWLFSYTHFDISVALFLFLFNFIHAKLLSLQTFNHCQEIIFCSVGHFKVHMPVRDILIQIIFRKAWNDAIKMANVLQPLQISLMFV